MSTSLDKLFEDGQSTGLSKAAQSVLVENLNALTIAGAQGTSLDELSQDEVTLFCVILDETGSMDPHRSTVTSAYNRMVEVIKASPNSDSILMSTWFFSTKPRLAHSYLPLGRVPELLLKDYNPANQTALFDATLHGLTSVVAYGQDLRNNGIRTKIVVVVFTDGEDNFSNHSPSDVRVVVQDLLKQELYHLALVAFGRDFAHQIAHEMGFINVLEVGATDADIRNAVGTVSSSVISVSQGKIGKSGSGGFFN